MLGLLCARVEVDVGKGIEFCHDDVDVVASDARREHRDAFAFVCTSNAVELAAAHFTLLLRKVLSYGAYSSWVAHKNDAVGQLLWAHVEVKCGAICVDR